MFYMSHTGNLSDVCHCSLINASFTSVPDFLLGPGHITNFEVLFP